MENAQETPAYLARMSAVLAADGDVETARALTEQLERRRTRGLLPADENAELRRLQRRVRTFRAIHAFEHAKPLHVRILEIQEATLGADHLDTMESLNDMALCLYNSSEFAEALRTYQRLLRITRTCFGPDDPLTSITLDNVRNCRRALRTARSIRQFGEHLQQILRLDASAPLVRKLVRADRQRTLASRLAARGKFRAAASVVKHAMDDSTKVDDLAEEDRTRDLELYAQWHGKAGDTQAAQLAHRNLVVLRNHQTELGQHGAQLCQALTDWAQSLDAMGDSASARTTLELAGRIYQQPIEDLEDWK